MTERQIRDALRKKPTPKARVPRRSLPPRVRQRIFAKTAGTCHVCGGSAGSRWRADHVVPYTRGGHCSEENLLPVCAECNRLRWSYAPDVLRLIIRLGIYAKHEIRHDTRLGRQIVRMAVKRFLRVQGRRVRHGGRAAG